MYSVLFYHCFWRAEVLTILFSSDFPEPSTELDTWGKQTRNTCWMNKQVIRLGWLRSEWWCISWVLLRTKWNDLVSRGSGLCRRARLASKWMYHVQSTGFQSGCSAQGRHEMTPVFWTMPLAHGTHLTLSSQSMGSGCPHLCCLSQRQLHPAF